jgi:RHS repeat-associated protein
VALSDAERRVEILTLAEQDYFPFGTPAIAGKPEAFGFTGQQQDTASGIVYLHARYYDPYLARFMSADTASPTLPGVEIGRAHV